MNIQEIKNRNQIIKYIEKLQDPIICEVGTRNGDFFYDRMLSDNCKLGIIVDIWQDTGDLHQNDNAYTQQELDSQYKKVFQRTLNYPNVKIIREFSHKACDFFSNETFDFVYIDADHSYEGCLRDLNCWYPKIKRGGILAGHDFISPELTVRMGHKTVFGVIQAVKEFLQTNNITDKLIHITPETYGTYFIRK